MPKQKLFLKDTKKKVKRSQQAPTSADEYLEVGVDFEEAGEKWRAGDAAKSTRFFIRAIDAYDEGLRKFPNSFDLAYNKARVQYELTQHPKLAEQLPSSLIELLHTALESSRFALQLRQDSPDVLFNTGQALTSLAQALVSENIGLDDAVPLLQEAMELFQRCLSLQQCQIENQMPDQPRENPSERTEATQLGQAEIEDDSMMQEEEEVWASVSEPVTNDTLVDTMLAQLETSTTLCGLMTPQTLHILDWLTAYSKELIDDKLPFYLQGTGRDAEARLAGINFLCAISDAFFRSGRYNAQEYEESIRTAFASYESIGTDPRALCDRAEAWITYNNSVRRHKDQAHHLISRWNTLTVAVQSLTAATKLPDVKNLATIHLLRGDVELLRYQLGQPPLNYPAAASNAATLLKNAATYYRGAQREADSSGLSQENTEARVKGLVVEGLGGNPSSLQSLMVSNGSATQAILEQCLDDGLLTLYDIKERLNIA
ncbi:hypothetical protein F5884DRAFT_774465 [Xylogone sp. PMI_703]|nr:hypothetical protein F5884DRAFT_774465 [Xylogone sp. PMI_703]